MEIFPLKVESPVNFDLEIDKAKPGSLHLVVTNRSARSPQSGVVCAVAQNDERAFVLKDLQPGKTAVFEVPLKFGNAEYTVKLESGWEISVKENLEVYPIPKLAHGIKLDGDLSDWDVPVTAVMDKESMLNQIKDWRGPSDLSGRLNMAWDSDNLYVGLIVTDSVHFQETMGWGMWGGDGIQIALDTRAKSEPSSSGYSEFGFSITSNSGLNQAWQWIAPAGSREGYLQPEYARVVRDGDRTVYEIALPWSLIGDFKARLGQVVKFSMLINDNDGEGRRGWMEWGKGIGDSKDADLFKLIQLGE